MRCEKIQPRPSTTSLPPEDSNITNETRENVKNKKKKKKKKKKIKKTLAQIKKQAPFLPFQLPLYSLKKMPQNTVFSPKILNCPKKNPKFKWRHVFLRVRQP
jgi:hypothetical protein